MPPAGFEPGSEARKAPILDRTRLRERNGRLVEEAINPFGARHLFRRAPPETTCQHRASTTQMRRDKPTITELAFFVSGLIVILTGWVADSRGLFELGRGSSRHAPSA